MISYIISDPILLVKKCIQFVGREQQGLVAKARNEFYGRNVENIYCMEEQELKKLLNYMDNVSRTRSLRKGQRSFVAINIVDRSIKFILK